MSPQQQTTDRCATFRNLGAHGVSCLRKVSSVLVLIGGALVIVSLAARSNPMADNQQSLREAHQLARQFEAQPEADRLREAFLALENVDLAQERDPRMRARLRADCLASWLHLLQLLDRHLDPNFNRGDVPATLVQPPPTRAGVKYPPGADPALIEDARARAEYEKAIAANRVKAERYRLQVQLEPVAARLESGAEAFIRNAYSAAPADQAEMRVAIDTRIQDPRRKAKLLNLLQPPPR
jgi:hypothetical protein